MIAEELKKCYWLVKNRILAGPYPFNPGIEKPERFLQSLLGLGVDSFVDLTEEDELMHYQKVLAGLSGSRNLHYQRFAIEDYSVPDHEVMQKIQHYLKSEIESGRCVYLHCFGGIGRTGTVAGCYLVEKGLSGAEALRQLDLCFRESESSSWARTPETDEQISFVAGWKSLNHGSSGSKDPS